MRRRPAQEGALADLEAELSSLRDGLAAAESEAARAPALEASLATSKDQYLRLQADFENFRRRTVPGGRMEAEVRGSGRRLRQLPLRARPATAAARLPPNPADETRTAPPPAAPPPNPTQAKEKDDLSARAKGDVVTGLLPLVDNFELARTQVGGGRWRGGGWLHGQVGGGPVEGGCCTRARPVGRAAPGAVEPRKRALAPAPTRRPRTRARAGQGGDGG